MKRVLIALALTFLLPIALYIGTQAIGVNIGFVWWFGVGLLAMAVYLWRSSPKAPKKTP